jgi:hypothetical protein
MRSLIKKGWFQVVSLGIIIGAILIVVDAKSGLFGKGENSRPKKFQGAIQANADEMLFTQVQFSQTKYDFGKVKEGDTVRHVFRLKNTGQEPLMIFKVKGSCDCLAAFYSEKPILPDQEGEIQAFFKTIGRKGHQSRTLYVQTNTDPSETVLTLTGDIE